MRYLNTNIPTYVLLKKNSVVLMRGSSVEIVPFKYHLAPMEYNVLQE